MPSHIKRVVTDFKKRNGGKRSGKKGKRGKRGKR